MAQRTNIGTAFASIILDVSSVDRAVAQLRAGMGQAERAMEAAGAKSHRAGQQMREGMQAPVAAASALREAVSRTDRMVDQLRAGMAQTTAQLKDSTGLFDRMRGAVDRLPPVLKKLAAGLSIAALLVALRTDFIGVVTSAAEFESAMARVRAVSGASDAQMAALTAQARELGATTSFSATQAAEGMQYLAMAGFDTNQITAAMPGLLNAAAAAQLDLGKTADIVSNIMTGFGIAAEESGYAADVLVYAANNSNTSVEQLGGAMKYAAPVAAALGLSLEDAAAAVAAMSDAGIQGEMAGTALRGAMVALSAPSKEAAALMKSLGINAFDAQGRMKSMPDVVAEFERATAGMTEQQRAATLHTIIGTEAMSGFLALMQRGPDDLRTFADELRNSTGTAAATAATQLDTFAGAMDGLKSALESVKISIGNALLPLLTDVVKGLTVVVQGTDKLVQSMGKLGAQIQEYLVPALAGATAAALALAVANAGQLGIALALVAQRLMLAAAAAGTSATAMGATAAATMAAAVPFVALAAAVAGAVLIYQKWTSIAGDAAQMWLGQNEAYQQSIATMTRYETASNGIQRALKGQADELAELQRAQEEDIRLRAEAERSGDKDAAWWEANARRINERTERMGELNGAITGYLDLAEDQGEADAIAAIAADQRAEAEQRVASALAQLRQESGMTAEQHAALAEQIQRVREHSEAGRVAADRLLASYDAKKTSAILLRLQLELLERAQQAQTVVGTALNVVNEAWAAAAQRVARAEAEKAAAIAYAAGDIEGALKILSESAGHTSDELADLEDQLRETAEAGRQSWNAIVASENQFRQQRTEAQRAYVQQTVTLEDDRQKALNKATTAHETKRADIERDYTKKRLEISADFAQKRADMVASHADKLAALERKKAEALIDAIQSAVRDGTQALDADTSGAADFVRGVEQRRADHNQTLIDLDRERTEAMAELERDYRDQMGSIEGKDAEKKRAEATRNYQRKKADLLKAQDEQRRSEEATFAEQERQAALAYAKEQAQQSEHLGRMLIQYTMAQGLMKGISKERIEAMTAALADEYGVQVTLAERSFGQMREVIDQWAEAGGEGTAQYTEQLGTLREEATASQIALDKLIEDRTAQVQTDFSAGRIGMDEYLSRLQAIPKEARTELGLDLTGVSLDQSQVGQDQAAIDAEMAAAKQAHAQELLALDADYGRQMQEAAQSRHDALVEEEAAYQTKITDEIEAGFTERQGLADAAYAEQERKAAEAYAAEQARQRADLGRSLIEHARVQGERVGMDPEKVRAMTDALAAEYGVQQTVADRMYDDSIASIDRWAARSGEGVDQVIADQRRYRDVAVEVQQETDRIRGEMIAQARIDLDAGKLDWDGYIAKLAEIPAEAARVAKALKGIPARIESEVVINKTTVDKTESAGVGGVGNRTTGVGVSGTRATGGPVSPFGLYRVVDDAQKNPELLQIGNQAYLMMGAQGGTVIPAMEAAMQNAGALAQQAALAAPLGGGGGGGGGAATPVPQTAPIITINLGGIHHPVVDTAERLNQMAASIAERVSDRWAGAFTMAMRTNGGGA